MRFRTILLLVVSVLVAGCLSTSSSGPTMDGFEVQETSFTGITSLQEAEGEPAYIGTNETGDYLVHGNEIIHHAPTILDPAYNGTTWGFSTGEGDERVENKSDVSVVIGEDTVGEYFLASVSTVGGTWAISGQHNESVRSTFLRIGGETVDVPLVIPRASYQPIEERFAYIEQRNGTRVLMHGDKEVARNPQMTGVVSMGGTPGYYRKTGSTRILHGNVSVNTTVLVHEGQTLGQGYYRVEDPVLGQDGHVYYKASELDSLRTTVMKEDEIALTTEGEAKIFPYKDSIAVAYTENGTGIIDAGGETIQAENGDISLPSVDVIDETLLYKVERGDLENQTVDLVYGDERTDVPFEFTSRFTAIDDRLYFTATDQKDNAYIVREKE